jgi:hypothetical protein
MSGLPANAEVMVVSPTGQLVLNEKAADNGLVELPDLKPGMYQVIIHTESSCIVQKLVIGL